MKYLKGTQESTEEGMTKIVTLMMIMMDDGDEDHEDVEVNYYDDII